MGYIQIADTYVRIWLEFIVTVKYLRHRRLVWKYRSYMKICCKECRVIEKNSSISHESVWYVFKWLWTYLKYFQTTLESFHGAVHSKCHTCIRIVNTLYIGFVWDHLFKIQCINFKPMTFHNRMPLMNWNYVFKTRYNFSKCFMRSCMSFSTGIIFPIHPIGISMRTGRAYMRLLTGVMGHYRLCTVTNNYLEATDNTHHIDVIMGTIASQITSLTIVYSTVYSDADQRKCQSSASLASVRGIHRRPLNSPHKWPENVSIGWRHHRDTHWKYILDHHWWLQNSHSHRKLIKVTIFLLTKNAEFVLNTGILSGVPYPVSNYFVIQILHNV